MSAAVPGRRGHRPHPGPAQGEAARRPRRRAAGTTRRCGSCPTTARRRATGTRPSGRRPCSSLRRIAGRRRAATDPMSRRRHGWSSTRRRARAGPGAAAGRWPGPCATAGCELSILLSRDFAEARAMAEQAVGRRGRRARRDGRRRDDAPRRQHGRRRARAADRRTTLGLIPAGTGNDLCRGLGLDPTDPVAAARVIAAGRTAPIDLALVGDTLRRRGAGHRLRRPGQPPGQRDDLAAGVLPLHPGRAGRAAGVLAAAVPADPRRRGPRAAGHAGRDRQHRLLRRRDADLPGRRPVRRLAGRHHHPSASAGSSCCGCCRRCSPAGSPGTPASSSSGPGR